MFSWAKTTEERMISEIGSELEAYRSRCETLHEEFRKKLRVRDEARAALAGADERIEALQKEGVSLLGNLNTAISGGEEEKLKGLESKTRRNARDLARARKSRERLARKLEAVEVNDGAAVRELKAAASEVLDEYSERVAERKRWLAGTADTLDSQREKLAREASPLTGEYEPVQPVQPGQSPETEEPSEKH